MCIRDRRNLVHFQRVSPTGVAWIGWYGKTKCTVFSNVNSADRLSRVTSQEKVLQKWLPLWNNSKNTPQSSLIRATLTVRERSFVKEFLFWLLFGKSLLWYTFVHFYFSAISQYKPTDATTNPSLLLAASKMPQYRNLFDKAVQYGKANGR